MEVPSLSRERRTPCPGLVHGGAAFAAISGKTQASRTQWAGKSASPASRVVHQARSRSYINAPAVAAQLAAEAESFEEAEDEGPIEPFKVEKS